jgi:hypothetical protein
MLSIPAKDNLVKFLTALFSTAVNNNTAIGNTFVVDRTEAEKNSGIDADTALLITAVCEKRFGKLPDRPVHDVYAKLEIHRPDCLLLTGREISHNIQIAEARPSI